VRGWVRWMAVLGGGLAAGLCVGFLHLKVQQANLEPTLLLKLVSLLLLGLGVALPWLLVNRWHNRRRQA
jgi:thiol:disulfide interchange protein